MIRTLFLPEYLNSYYLLPQRIIGFDIEKTQVYATVVLARRNKRIIEQCLQEPIEVEPTVEFASRAAAAVKRIIDRVGSYDAVYTSLPSTHIVFKELSLPFTNLAKIKMVLPFEIEPLLPFAANQAIIDGIITKIDETQKQADVFVAAVKKELIEEQIALFGAAGIPIDKITIDLLELINLYHVLPELMQKEDAVVFIYSGFHATYLMLFVHNNLKSIRVLSKGIIQFARDLTVTQQNEGSPSFETILTDLETPRMKEQATKVLSDIPFTIETLLSKLSVPTKLATIVLTGPGVDIKGMPELISSLTNTPCVPMPISKILHNGTVSARSGVSVTNSFVVSIATALSIGLTKEFNLNKELVEQKYERNLLKQLIAAALLILTVLSVLTIYRMVTTRKLHNEIAASEQEAIKSLKTAFPHLAQRRDITKLSLANNAARQELTKEETIWFALSPQNRISIVTTLQELSTRIDREGLGLELKRLTINETSVTMEGSVRDFHTLRLLEDALNESGLFETVPKLQEPKFILTMMLKKKEAS
jgi:general secretion pathway protein L